jgi:antitoxin YefM
MDEGRANPHHAVIVRGETPDAAPTSLDEFNGSIETVHLLKSPADEVHLVKSIAYYPKVMVRRPE